MNINLIQFTVFLKKYWNLRQFCLTRLLRFSPILKNTIETNNAKFQKRYPLDSA